MKSLDELPINVVIAIYHEKCHAIRQGDMNKLLELKSKYPDLFDTNKEEQLEVMFEYAKEFKSTLRYEELCRIEDNKNKKLFYH